MDATPAGIGRRDGVGAWRVCHAEESAYDCLRPKREWDCRRFLFAGRRRVGRSLFGAGNDIQEEIGRCENRLKDSR